MEANNELPRIAAAELGVTEFPANSNNVKFNTWFYGRTVSGTAYPWCMAFVQWCFDQAGKKLPYKTASCSALLNWYRMHQPECVAAVPQPGDIVIYNFGHTGIVESASASTITAIEGNTSASNSGSQSNGGGVFRKVRSKSLATAYIRPIHTQKKENLMTGNEILDALTEEQAYQLLVKAQRHAAKLPEPAWSKNEGHWQRAVETGVFTAGCPEGLLKRDEAAAVLGRKGLL